MLRASFGEDVVSETLCRLLVEDAVSLKHAESVGIQHLCPFVTVVASSVASRHDVRELHRHAGVLHLFADDGFLPGVFLKRLDIVRKGVLLRVVGHVEQSERYLSQTGRCCHEVTAFDDACYQFVGEWFSRLVVEGEGAQKFFLYGEILHELRGQFHEVPPHVGAAETFEACVGEHAVQ